MDNHRERTRLKLTVCNVSMRLASCTCKLYILAEEQPFWWSKQRILLACGTSDEVGENVYLGLFVENRFGLSTVTRLFSVITTLTLWKEMGYMRRRSVV